MINSAVVWKYGVDDFGWVLRYGLTSNIEHNPATEEVVPINSGEVPMPNVPLWRQRVVSGVFASANAQDTTAAEIWLARKFVASKTVLFQQTEPLQIMANNPVVVGAWMSDSRAGIFEEGLDSRVFGAIFKWTNPSALRPPVMIARGHTPKGTITHSLTMTGEPTTSEIDGGDSYEFWRVVTADNEPQELLWWTLEVSVPTIVPAEVCQLSALRLSKGRRGI